MRKTRKAVPLYPWGLGLDTNSLPGAQKPQALREAKNTIIDNRGALRKAPGVTKIPYVDNANFGRVQAAIHFFATSGGSQRSEIIVATGGRLLAIRDEEPVDLGVSFSDTDVVTFERFSNLLLIHFENSPTLKYTIGGTPETAGLLASHQTNPPRFSRVHDFAWWYAGRTELPHYLYKSQVNNPEGWTLLGGARAMRIFDGDGDPVGITGISPTFRRDLYVMKWNSVYRVYRSQYGYGIDPVIQNEVGCVGHNTIVRTPNDIIYVSNEGIHSLVSTSTWGAVEEKTLSYQIYDYFKEDVNWSAHRHMVSHYDKPSNSYMLSYASSGSSQNNKILGFNIASGQFYEWEDTYYPVLANYYDFGRQRTMVGDVDNGLGFIDETTSQRFGKEFSFSAKTGHIFPFGPSAELEFTKCWVFGKPTTESVKFNLKVYVDGNLILTEEGLDLRTEGARFQDKESGIIGTMKIGTDIIGDAKDGIKTFTIELKGKGSSIEFEIEHEPDGDNQFLSVYGLAYEFEHNEDDDNARTT